MNNKNPYRLKLIGIIVFSLLLIFIFVLSSSNKNIKADDLYIHKLTIGNNCVSNYINKMKLENILITYKSLESIEEKCK